MLYFHLKLMGNYSVDIADNGPSSGRAEEEGGGVRCVCTMGCGLLDSPVLPGRRSRWHEAVGCHPATTVPVALHHNCLPLLSCSRLRRDGKTLSSIRRARLLLVASSSSSSSSPPSSEQAIDETAESCVKLGLSLFSKGRVKDALTQFEKALLLEPNPVETQAALYNKACCHAYRGEGKKTAECLQTALRDYDLKFSTILNDPDLASFRALQEFKELQEEASLGGEDVGYGFRRDLKLISEVQAPFRGIRRFFYAAFTAAAGISTFFTIPRLIRAISGGEGAPDIQETLINAGINIGGIIALVALFIWENKKEEEQISQITRNETLSRLPLRLSTNRVVELVQLRDTTRPVILAGNKETVSRAIQKAERFRTELLQRGVLLIPIIWGDVRKNTLEKKGFGVTTRPAASLPSIGEDFDKRTQSIASRSRLKAEVRFKAETLSTDEWERWILDQQKAEGVNPGDDVYIILRLDGRVRRSGRGMPDWEQFVKELPPIDTLLSKLER